MASATPAETSPSLSNRGAQINRKQSKKHHQIRKVQGFLINSSDCDLCLKISQSAIGGITTE
ncbi:hypothetical protein NGX06_001060 [Clostridioides difficile]|uniref:hypothetical protein n=1 Tax=Clostridioides difficile TaxID=1496 RepID=UPI001F2A178F|nr:hypothetical protein [Clostridioides difficile]MCE4841325.1 hypothetical protein [Clostridioides difficile]MCG3605416.1 hypothetical protein [Clostridioides difficile]MCI2352536.1 hypothetical protein [Clostridioides difficile]MCK8693356.1 hypothetical protein [Clostridioides difficile]MCL6903663.1 hypothetical protein [Clostridioides difficile]